MLINEPKTEALEKLWHTRQCVSNLTKDQAMDIMSNLSVTLERIDEAIDTFKESAAEGEMLKRLQSNPDFVHLFINKYIDTEAKKLFNILIDPSGASPYSEDELRRKLDAVGNLRGYISDIEIAATAAPLSILREEQYRKEVTAEAAREDQV